MAQGGARPGAGRPKGAAAIKTREIADKAAQAGLTPLEFMLEALRDENKPFEVRFEAAKQAAPYIHPKLTATKVSGDENAPLETVIRWAKLDTEATPDPSKK